jgi:hypothetical protein
LEKHNQGASLSSLAVSNQTFSTFTIKDFESKLSKASPLFHPTKKNPDSS